MTAQAAENLPVETAEPSGGSKRIKWRQVVKEAITEASSFKRRVGVAPTLRGLFYALVSREVLPNTRNAYARLSRVLAKARKDGVFPWDLLKDTTRKVLGGDSGESLSSLYSQASNVVSNTLSDLLNAVNTIGWRGSFSPFKWAEQPKRVIFCLEKEALADAIHSLTSDWGVEIYVMRGYASTTSMKRLADKLRRYPRYIDVVLLLLTDYDPSGEDIVRYIKGDLTEDFGVAFECEKVAVTLPQIDQFNLPSSPETAAERAKMMRDSRFKNWDKGFFRVEIDALMSIVPDEFRTILNNAVEKHFDYIIEEAVNERVRECEEFAKAQLNDLSSKLGVVRSELKRLLEEAPR